MYSWITIVGNVFLILLTIFLCFLFFLLVILRIIRKIHKFPIPAFATRLIDNAWRRKFIQKPEKIADHMNLEKGMIVVEIGPGKGNYTKTVAKRLLPDGKVYAIDIQNGIINRLKKRIVAENIPNIIARIEDVYHLQFNNNSVDRIFAITCLPEIPDPVKVLKEFKRIL
ncbi:MAG: class I SAM-dependent methyltransferase, partial [Promethearchaeota archaeon]